MTFLPNQVQRTTLVRAPRPRVWRALTDIREFCRWFQCSTEAPAFEAGAHIALVSTYPGKHQGTPFSLEVVELSPPQTFRWRWHPNALDPAEDLSGEPMTLVTFQLEEADGGTRVTITETGFDQLFEPRRKSAYESNDGGWRIQLAALEQYVDSEV